ncbi:M20/M25/M40 family metallo-hydrolase [Paludisphaera sp.]|uniref:M20/M25/M40 family metallo-hydrolase n=1 Tax=Paludisphaera sp. TaxID=2017432 RepID=UPI00301E3F7C
MLRIREMAATLAVAGLFGLVSFSQTWAQAPAPTPTPPAAEAETKAEPEKKPDPIALIKEEGEERSRVMETLETLTDVIGPRLSGSPALKRANEWTRDRMAEWGMENARLEAWGPFGRGWTLKRFSAQVVEPQCIPLIALPKAWSPALDGTLTADVVHFDAKSEADFEKYKGKLKGAIVLIGPPIEVPARFEPLARRKTDKQLLDLADAPDPNVPRADRPRQAPARPARPRVDLPGMRQKFLADEGAALLIEPSRNGDGGTLFVQSASVVPSADEGEGEGQPPKRLRAWDKEARVIPQLVMAKEHYNRLVRMLAAGEKPRMAVDLAVEFQDEDMNCYNTVAEIPGTDLKDEVVMLGGHLDSWHGGTGATDNAAGCAAAMEAARIIKALDLKPRRTIRVALWTGEEQGIFGSKAYVDEHFRKRSAGFGEPPSEADDAEATKPEYDKLSGYFNLDNGTGRIRGVYLQGNEAVRPIFREWLRPFRDMGAQTLSMANTGGTDHLPFDAVGLPGFQFIQDEIEYGTRTHHSNMDVYDRAQADDLRQASIIMAAFVYNTAMMDEKLPRKPAPVRPEGRPSEAAGN